MKTIYLPIFSFFLNIFFECKSIAQCPSGSISFSSQTAVNNFGTNYPSCTTISGNLSISGTTTLNLIPLSNLTNITGNLSIVNCTNITNMTGIHNITTVGGTVRLQNNDALTSYASFTGINSIGGSLIIAAHNSLTNITGFSNLTTLYNGTLEIRNNNVLVDFQGLYSLHKVSGDLLLYSNPLTASFSGLSALDTVSGSVQINSNNALLNLNGINNLKWIGVGLSVYNNPSLQNLQGLNALTKVETSLNINSNASLQNLVGLNNLNSIGTFLSIDGNANLTSIASLSMLTSVGTFIQINSNAKLTSIAGLDNIIFNPVTNSISFYQNPLLSYCHVSSVCSFLNTSSSSASIYTNKIDCNSVLEVQNACLGIFPIELVSLNINLDNNKNYIHWKTASELNNNYFEIEKSHDCIYFNSIGIVKSKGDLGADYSYEDLNPFIGMNYYRLKQVDHYATFTYSLVKSILNDNSNLTVFPNPIKNIITIFGEFSTDVSFSIFNTFGASVMNGILQNNELLVHDLQPGKYILVIGNQVTKIIKD
jgi:acyl-[acyl carrier protein]--UDP-N-acetylglucosamine O-acyltransferase